MGLVHRVADIVKRCSLGHGEYVLSVLLKPRQSVAGKPPAAWQGPNIKIFKIKLRSTLRRVMFHGFEKLQNKCCTTVPAFARMLRTGRKLFVFHSRLGMQYAGSGTV